MTSFVMLMILLLFIAILRYNVIVVEESGESYPLLCRAPTPAVWFFMADSAH